MATTVWAKIGVYLAPEDRYKSYFDEALHHLGLAFHVLDTPSGDQLHDIDVLLLCGYGSLNETQVDDVSSWVSHGGGLVCCGSTWGLGGVLGLNSDDSHASNDVARAHQADRLWPEGAQHVRFFGGTLATAKGCQTIASTDSGRVALSRRKVGKGLALFVGPHVAQTMALMQMGRSVETDGIGPSDGSAILDDGILRAEDGSTLSFDSDRSRAEGCPTPYFAYPHADVVREFLMRAALNAVDSSGKSTVVLWHWPHMAAAAAMLTLDCEDFTPEHVYRTYQILSLHGCPATWLIGQPGYPLAVYRSFRAWEHEVGCLFSGEGETGWDGERLKLQHIALTRAASLKNAFACRPTAGRWRGWDSFYAMCQRSGARVSVSKGGRQAGTAGFLFGTCHPFFPRRSDGSDYLVSEMPYTAYMPGMVTDDAVCDAIFSTTLARGGCFHMVSRPEVTADTVANASLRRLISVCRQNRVEFVSPEQTWRFEKARRSLRRVMTTVNDDSQLLLIPDVAIEGLSVMFTGPAVSIEIKNRMAQVRQLERYGTSFSAVQLDVEQKQHLELRVYQVGQAAA